MAPQAYGLGRQPEGYGTTSVRSRATTLRLWHHKRTVEGDNLTVMAPQAYGRGRRRAGHGSQAYGRGRRRAGHDPTISGSSPASRRISAVTAAGIQKLVSSAGRGTRG